MTTSQVFIRMVLYGIALGALDAVSGRTLQASPEPTLLVVLLAAAWVGFSLGAMQRGRLAMPAAFTLFAAYISTFTAVAHLLVGWNNSVPWQPDVGRVAWFTVAATVVAAVFATAGARSRATSDAKRDAHP